MRIYADIDTILLKSLYLHAGPMARLIHTLFLFMIDGKYE